MDRWTIREPDAGPLVVEGPRLGDRDDGGVPAVEVVAASNLPNRGLWDAGSQGNPSRRERAKAITFTGKKLLDEGRFLGHDYRHEIVVGQATRAYEEGGTGGYWVWVHNLNRPDLEPDHCIYEAWWLLDLPEVS